MTDLTLVPHVTQTAMPSAAPLKKVAILGTAQSWKQCPWNDAGLEIWGLNDAYLIGVPRATAWFDLHPPHQMNFRAPTERQVAADSVPVGVYLRPAGHLDWLRSRPMPVFMAEASTAFPNATRFPREAVLEHFKAYWPWRVTRTGVLEAGPDYEVSTPAWMLMKAIMEGYTEIHIYGIHLATQWEYIQQRPNFEFLMGIAAGKGIKIVLPASTPICRASYRYAFEPKGDLAQQAAEVTIGRLKQEGLALRQQLATLPFYARGRKHAMETRLARLDVELADARQIQQRATVKGL